MLSLVISTITSMINLLPSNPRLSRNSKGPEPRPFFIGRRDTQRCLATSLLRRPTHWGTPPWSQWRFSPFSAPVLSGLSSCFSAPYNQRKDGQYWGRPRHRISRGSQQWVCTVSKAQIYEFPSAFYKQASSCNLWITDLTDRPRCGSSLPCKSCMGRTSKSW